MSEPPPIRSVMLMKPLLPDIPAPVGANGVSATSSTSAHRAPQVPTTTGVAPGIEKTALIDVSPILVGLIPFAGVVGITMAALDIPVLVGVIGSALVFAGSAQLAVLGLLGSGAGIVPMLISVLLINSRFAMYGGALEPMFRRQPRWFRLLGPHLLVDQNYGLATVRNDITDPRRFRQYWMTTSMAIGAVWLTTIAGAMIFGQTMPKDSPLSFSATCIYIALLVPNMKDRTHRHAASSAAVTALAFAGFTSGLGVLAGVLVGVSVAALHKVGRS
jgi:predicted branched-subunit amino acid permease